MTLKQKLVTAAHRYDDRQVDRKGRLHYYNPHALGQYLARIDQVVADIERGADPKAAIMAGFTGALRTAMLKAIGEMADHRESGTAWHYVPVTKEK